MPPMLRWALGRLPLGEDERARLQREAFASRGFVPRLERLLVAVDQTAKGAFALRLAGLLAGSLVHDQASCCARGWSSGVR
jgi:hypothetical protein